MGRYHTVRPGDCVSSLAERNGHFWETIWNAPENEELRAVRSDPNCLAPGDRIFVPDRRRKDVDRAIDQTHRFKRCGVPSKLVLRILWADGRPRPDARYTLEIDGAQTSGKTDADGYLRATIAGTARKGKVILHSDDEDEPDEDFPVMLGHLAPHDDLAGAQARLHNLGAHEVKASGEIDEETQQAIEAFQKANDLDPTGELDEETAAALRDAHGS